MAYSKDKAKQIYADVLENGVACAASLNCISVDSVKRAVRIATEQVVVEPALHKATFIGQEEGPVLIIPDLHAPYHHPQAIEFLKWVHKEFGCQERVVCSGDIMDFHAQSRHVSEVDAWNPKKEYQKAIAFTEELCEVFPKGDLVCGNHDLVPQRQMKEIGLLPSMLKESHDLYGMGEDWNIHPLFHVIDPEGWNVLVEHGIGSGGKYGCANTAKEKRCSYVQGHTHSAAAVIYSSNYNSTIFGMNVGCLVDHESLAMRYGKYGTRKGVLGCGLVYSGQSAEFIHISRWPDYKG